MAAAQVRADDERERVAVFGRKRPEHELPLCGDAGPVAVSPIENLALVHGDGLTQAVSADIIRQLAKGLAVQQGECVRKGMERDLVQAALQIAAVPSATTPPL